jgi:hypothetical protein
MKKPIFIKKTKKVTPKKKYPFPMSYVAKGKSAKKQA